MSPVVRNGRSRRGGAPRLLRLLAPLGRWALLGCLLSLLTLLANMALLALSSWFISSMALAGAQGLTMNYTTPAAAVRALALARAGGRYAERLVNHGTTLRILEAVRVWFFRGIVPLAPAALGAKRSGDLLSRIRADVDTLDDFYVRGVVPALVAVLGTACVVPFLAHYDRRLAWIDLAALLGSGLLLPLVLRGMARAAGARRVTLSARLRANVVEEVQGMAELLVLGAREAHAADLESTDRALGRAQRRLSSFQGLSEAGLVAGAALAVWGAALVVAPRVAAGTLAGADMAMLTVLVLASFEAVMPFPAAVQRAGEASAAARRLLEIMDDAPSVRDPADPVAILPAHAADGALGIVIRDLWFRYAPEEPWVLRGFDLEVGAGERLILRGRTGCGKSTLVNLLLRFWDYQSGSIHLGPWELRSLRADDTRRLMGVSAQNAYLFHDTIRANLRIAAPHAPLEALRSALVDVRLGTWLNSLPQGLETVVGETGLEVSTGQARRLCVARALLTGAPITILDEPTEGLDDLTARALLRTVDERLEGRTLVVVSHRERDRFIARRVVDMGAVGP